MDMENKKPLLRRSKAKGKIYAGFLNINTGEFIVDREFDIDNENEIDRFLDDYGITFVAMSKMD